MEVQTPLQSVGCTCKANVVFFQVEEACSETSARLGWFPAAVKCWTVTACVTPRTTKLC